MTGCILLVITLARYIILAQTPLDLDVEEAQYWLWSQSPDAGYFSKPPMIAWVIGLGTGIFGNTVFGVKAAAPLIQLISALLIGRVARDMAGVMAGRLAMLFWITLPASAIAGFIISTDSPMLMFLLAMLVVIAGFPSAFVAILFTGSLLIEIIFSIDGMGLLTYDAIIKRDYPIMFGNVYILTLVGLLMHLLSDLIYVLVDPRIDFETR